MLPDMTTDDDVRRAAEELVDAEIADDLAQNELEEAKGDERVVALTRKARAMKARDKALSRLASLLGKKWPPQLAVMVVLLVLS